MFLSHIFHFHKVIAPVLSGALLSLCILEEASFQNGTTSVKRLTRQETAQKWHRPFRQSRRLKAFCKFKERFHIRIFMISVLYSHTSKTTYGPAADPRPQRFEILAASYDG